MKNDEAKRFLNTVSPTCTNCGEEDALRVTFNPITSFRRTRECKECGEPFRLTRKQWLVQVADEIICIWI